jgi:hypothetical protein
MSKPTAYLHIGTHKTGTTVLQAWCLKNHEALAKEYNLYYPTAFTTTDGHHGLARNISTEIKHKKAKFGGNEDFKLSDEEILKELDLKNHKNQDLLLSSETFSIITIDEEIVRLKNLLKDYDIKVIVYIRHLVERVQSGYSEVVKKYNTHKKDPIEKVMSVDQIDGRIFVTRRLEMLEIWNKHFGKKNVTVRPYIRKELKNQDILDDFFESIGYGDIELRSSKFQVVEDAKQNISPTSMGTEAIRQLNNFRIFGKLDIGARANFVLRVAKNPGLHGNKVIFENKNYSVELLNKYMDQEENLCDKYFPELKDYFTSLPQKTWISDLSLANQIKYKLAIKKFVYSQVIKLYLKQMLGRA